MMKSSSSSSSSSSSLRQVGRCTDDDYRTYTATQTVSVAGDESASARASGSDSSCVATVSTVTPLLQKVELDWEKEGISWNADGSLVFKPDETTKII